MPKFQFMRPLGAVAIADLKRGVRAARDDPRVNPVLSGTARWVASSLGRESAWLRKHLPRAGIARLALPNGDTLRLWSRGDDWISTQIFWAGVSGYEPETVPLWFHLAAQSETIVDVGAFVGYMTLLAALANRRARVVALEPNPPTFDRLLRNLQLNGVENVIAVNLAAGAMEGKAVLHHAPHGFSSAASLNPRHLAMIDDMTTTEVPVRRLDSLIGELGLKRVELLKLDTETTEADVLDGAAETIARDRPHIVCEVLGGESAARLTRMLAPLGYRFYELAPDDLREHTEVPVPASLNCLFSTWSKERLDGLRRWT
jgi:FkbM family methyltransferase